MATTRKAAVADDIAVEVENGSGAEPEAKPRRGRPADSDGLTGQRILAAAQECFAESGYVAASTHMVAARVGLTTGALYHHFGSKRELYLAVFDEVETLVFDRFRTAMDSRTGFVEKFEAMLDEAVRLSTADPAVAGFILSVSGDLARHPDLREAVQSGWKRRDSIFAEVVDEAIANGEIAASDRRVVLDMLTTMIGGLLTAGAGIPAAQDRAVTGFKKLL